MPSCLAGAKQSFEAVDMPPQYFANFPNMIEPEFLAQPALREAMGVFLERRKPNFWTREMIERRKR